jgi:hypothetical protein
MFAKLSCAIAVLLWANLSLAAGALENPQPNSIQTGIGTISGWSCPPGAIQVSIQIQIDGGPLVLVPSGSSRGDTQTICGRSNTGFGYLLNYNTLAVGPHTINVLANGLQFASTTFSTMKPAGEFLSGINAGYWLNNFPAYGERSHVDWSEAKQNFSITATDTDYIHVAGNYFGATTYIASNCTAASKNGRVVEYGAFTVNYPTDTRLTIIAALTTNYTCSYIGVPAVMSDGTLSVGTGTFSCSNGAQGTWTSSRVVVAPDGISAQISSHITVGETCHSDGTIGGARLR